MTNVTCSKKRRRRKMDAKRQVARRKKNEDEDHEDHENAASEVDMRGSDDQRRGVIKPGGASNVEKDVIDEISRGVEKRGLEISKIVVLLTKSNRRSGVLCVGSVSEMP